MTKTKVSDLSASVDDLLDILPGGDKDVAAALDKKMPSAETLTGSSPADGDRIGVSREDGTNPGSYGHFSYTIANLKTFLGTGGQGSGYGFDWTEILGSGAGSATTLNIGQGLQGFKSVLEPHILELSVSDEIVAQAEPPCFLSLAQKEMYTIAQIGGGPGRSVLWLGSSLMPYSPAATGSQEKGTITLSPRMGRSYEQFMILFSVSIMGAAPESGRIRIYVQDRGQGGVSAAEYMKDVNGIPLAVQRAYKTGDNFGDITLVGIIETAATLELSFHLEHEFPRPLNFGYNPDPKRPENTVILIQAADTRLDAVSYLHDTTAFDLKWRSYTFDNPLSSLGASLQSDLLSKSWSPTASAAHQDIFYENGIALYVMDHPVSMGISNKVMTIHKTAVGATRFVLGHVFFDENEVILLRGKTLSATVTLVQGVSPADLIIWSWNGDGDTASAPLPPPGSDWTAIATDNIVGNASARRKGSVSVTVPADSRQLFVALEAHDTSDYTIGIEEYEVNIDPSFSGMRIISPVETGESILSPFSAQAVFVQAKGPRERWIRYTINDNESACPVGVLQSGSTLNVELDDTLNQVVGSQILSGEGVIHFLADADEATITTEFHLYPDASVSAGTNFNVTFTWYSFANNGSTTPVPNGSKTIAMTGGHPPTFVTFPFSGAFSTGDKIGLQMKSDANGIGYLYTSDPGTPLIRVKITDERLPL